MPDIPVCIIGCGPIGLTGALLLSRHGVKSLLVERRSELNTHPRSRFVDTNTMELLRELGLEKQVEETGLGPDWTAYNRWADSLAASPYANIPSPTFLSVPGPDSPCVPVMTVQDEVEKALMSQVAADSNITVRFDTEAVELTQSETCTQVTLRDTNTDERVTLTALYTIGADGPGSGTRTVIGTKLAGEPEPLYMQDVIFHADLETYVGERKGALLYTQPPDGVVIFQPLDGRRRWRCQIAIRDESLITEEAAMGRIRASLGTDDDVELQITSMRMWQPTPGCTTHFSDGRIFLAGDAAHVSVPTGGLGNNSGFAGIRNLAWKLAYVIRGLAPQSILDTYEIEHRPIALERIEYGVVTTTHMRLMMVGHRNGDDIAEHIQATHRYADYDHVVRGFEMSSSLIAPNTEAAPHLENPSQDFSPLIRSGRRAPHLWVDEEETVSVLDWFGTGYVLLLGPDCDAEGWQAAVASRTPEDVPLVLRQLPDNPSSDPYHSNGVVLVRPDGVIAQHGRDTSDQLDAEDVLAYLPFRQRHAHSA